MGYDVHRFIDETIIDDKHICVICTMVLENPMQSNKCEHTFCHDCIMQWLAINKTCPLDRLPVDVCDMQPSAGSLRDLLNQLKMKCDYVLDGCTEPIQLHCIKDHVRHCKFNPNLMIICDKGCGLEMTYREYNKTNCFAHLANMVIAQQKQIDLLLKQRQIWQKYNGLKTLMTDPTMLRHVLGKQLSFAQSIHSLERGNFYFAVKVLELGDGGKMSIGLTDSKYPIDKHPGFVKNSIAYHGHDGRVYINSEIGSDFGPIWQKDDVIGCGIKFGPENDLVYETFRVYFTKNDQCIGERRMTMFCNEMFPTIGMQSSGAIVKFLD